MGELKRLNKIKREWGDKMEYIKIEWIGIFFFFLVLVSIQVTLNKIVVLLQEAVRLLKSRK